MAAPAREDKVRAFVRETINTVLTTSPQIKPQTPRPPCPPAGDDQHLVIRQRPLQRFRFVPWRAHPHVVLLFRRQDHRHGLWVDRLDDSVRRRRQHTVDKMRRRRTFGGNRIGKVGRSFGIERVKCRDRRVGLRPPRLCPHRPRVSPRRGCCPQTICCSRLLPSRLVVMASAASS